MPTADSTISSTSSHPEEEPPEKETSSNKDKLENTAITPPTLLLQNIPHQLWPNSTFSGSQKSGKSCYNVQVEIKHVDLNHSFLCGYLKIKGLTDDWPQLCTFFEGEIIGKKYSFLTRKWDADLAIDRQHWMKFAAFSGNPAIVKEFSKEGFVYNHEKSDFIFMRWKEHFLVPDHQIKNINGASFAGFYYIVFQKSTGQINGIYFHKNSEWFQQLSLTYIPSNSWSSWEFN